MEEVEVAGFFTGNCCVTGRLFLVLVLVAVVVVVVCSIGGGGGVFFILGGLGGATLTGVSTPATAGVAASSSNPIFLGPRGDVELSPVAPSIAKNRQLCSTYI